MDYQPLRLGRMQECGSSLLKSLQNDSMVPLDLLVRESIQNSLDAAAGSEPVRLEFQFSEHETETISELLGGEVAKELRSRYQKSKNWQLVIRDWNTVGLTGPLKVDELAFGETQGNFFKLVYAVGRSQDEAHRGGSWGLGKTIYFRIGCGLVFYYTRIKVGADFEERLAVCLVEDERSPGKLQKKSQTGIAWWGSGEDGPVLETAEIDKVLQALGVPRYINEETGTVVVVPFLAEKLGPPATEPEEPGITAAPLAEIPWWHRTYSDYVRIAIQRWYGVRLNNPKFPGAPLNAAVDGVAINEQEVLPVIKIARQLYQSARDRMTGPREIRDPLGGDPIKVEVSSIALRAAVKGTTSVGRVAIAIVNRQQLGMEPPHNNPAPQTILSGSRHKGMTAPIVGFLRRPGMIVQWDDRGDSNGWARRATPAPEGEYVIAMVVPDGELPLYPGVAEDAGLSSGASHTLEGYLRNCEKADHNDWIDPLGQTIVTRMRARVSDSLQRVMPQAAVVVPSLTPFLGARTIADRLLPEGFGTDGRREGSADDGGAGHDGSKASNRSARPRLDIRRLEYHDHGFTLHWRLTWKGKPEASDLRLLVDTEGSPISKESWKTDGLGAFPLALRQATAAIVAPAGNEWSVSVDKRADAPGIRITPKGPKGAAGAALTVEGSLEVGVTNPKGAPVRSVLVVDRVTDAKS